MALYPKNSDKSLNIELFKKPTAEYRGTPFWAWNGELNKEKLLRQMDVFKEMGLGGGHMHPRTGMATPYLSDEFMDLVKACNEKAKKDGMLAWLYDEDRWPSGFAGGLVTSNHEYRAKHLLITTTSYDDVSESGKKAMSEARGERSHNGELLAKYEVVIEKDVLSYYKRLANDETPKKGGRVWYVYLEYDKDSSWYNNQAYVDTLQPSAIKKFIEVTHERYKEAVGDDFGKSIPAIFTDEPQTTFKCRLNHADSTQDIFLPYTCDFTDTYKTAYDEDILDKIPELIWELPNSEISVSRYRYHDHVTERFAQAFFDQIGKWCDDNNILLTGHLMNEPTLNSQCGSLGEAMRHYRGFGLPGIDMLCDWREFTTAKQAQSVARQLGKPGVLSELYGVTNWNFDFRGHKSQGDWQAALGVTVRVHHLTWYAMKGEAKRDYPASMGEHSPWYKEYAFVEDHFARLNTALTRGKAISRIGVVHPIESTWIHWGSLEQTESILHEQQMNFFNLTELLLDSQLDFDFISESLLSEQKTNQAGKKFNVGEMAYDVVVVPNCETLRSSTLEKLTAFKNAGGTVIFVGNLPKYIDAVPSGLAAEFAKSCAHAELSSNSLITALSPFREVDVRYDNGIHADNLFYQLRQDDDSRWFFLCHGRKPQFEDSDKVAKLELKLRGEWNPEIWDTQTGKTAVCPAVVEDGWMVINLNFSGYDSLLLKLNPGKPNGDVNTIGVNYPAGNSVLISDPVCVKLQEPNVLLLDFAEYALDGGDWQPAEELLRINNIVRHQLGWGEITGYIAQPWADTTPDVRDHQLKIRFTVKSEVAVSGVKLALEELQHAEVTVNGKPVTTNADGIFVDETIQTIALPGLKSGDNEIIVTYAYGKKSLIEWHYLLGDFGVKHSGRHSVITEPVTSLTFGDWTTQGLPFYGGNVVYQCEFNSNGGEVTLQAPQYRAPVIAVWVDGKKVGHIAYSPYSLQLGKLPAGKHKLDIVVYGSRINQFGALHCCDPSREWHGPDAWRTTGRHWAYEHQLKSCGLIIAPTIWEQ